MFETYNSCHAKIALVLFTHFEICSSMKLMFIVHTLIDTSTGLLRKEDKTLILAINAATVILHSVFSMLYPVLTPTNKDSKTLWHKAVSFYIT